MRLSSAFAALAAFAAAPAAFAGTINVPADYSKIQAAIDAAVDGDVIIVAQGTYTENIDFKGKAITVDGIDCKTTFLLSGGPGPVVRFASGEGPSSILSGFAVKYGTGELVSGKRYGGGVYIANASSPTLLDNCIGFNSANLGAGIFIDTSCNPLIQNNLVANNFTANGGSGGGVYSRGTPIFDGNRVAENGAPGGTGGGMTTEGTSPTISNCDFDTNFSFYGGGLHVVGGAPTITGSLFDNNTVLSAPVNGEGAGLALVNKSTAFVSGSTFHYNTAHSGGGIYIYDASPNVVLNTIKFNDASLKLGYGAGISMGKAGGSIELNEIYYNTGNQGAGMSIRAKSTALVYGNIVDHNAAAGAKGMGGGIQSVNATAFLVANTIADNSAIIGGGFHASGSVAPTINSSIIWGNTASTTNPSIFDGTGVLIVQFCDVEGTSLGGSSLSIDPLFANPVNRDYRLSSGSPVVDAGDFTLSLSGFDVYGNPRVINGRVDMGGSEQ